MIHVLMNCLSPNRDATDRYQCVIGSPGDCVRASRTFDFSASAEVGNLKHSVLYLIILRS
jgi:hypothetical protein